MTIIKPQRYQKAAALAPRADDRDVIERLAGKAQATAAEFGVTCDRRQAIQRSRENLQYVRALATAKGGRR